MSAESPIFIRLYLDEDVSDRVASALRLRGFDVLSAHDVERWGLSDQEQLRGATAEGRCVFTFNAPYFCRLHTEWMRQDQEHCGIIVSDQLPIGEVTRRLLRLLNSISADEMRNQVYWLAE